MAASRLLAEKKTSGLQAGLIVNEIYMRSWPKDKEPPNWENRSEGNEWFNDVAIMATCAVVGVAAIALVISWLMPAVARESTK